MSTPDDAPRTILLIGASRGLGLALADEFAGRGWSVVATARDARATRLDDVAARHRGRIEIETVDIAEPERIAALRDRLAGRRFDMLFVNAGTGNARDEPMGEIATAEFSRVMATNGRHPIYRASKSALNQLMRSYAAIHAEDGHALVLMAPGWIRTDLGGAHAPFSVEEAIPAIADVLVARMGTPGLRYLDRFGNAVAW